MNQIVGKNSFSKKSFIFPQTLGLLALCCCHLSAQEPLDAQPANTWVKRSPLPDSPVSPRLGYEGACVWDSQHRLLVRYGGHNQGGGGEQGAEAAGI